MKYVFDPDVVHECGLAGLGRKKPEMFDAVARALEDKYPGHIWHDQPWIYSIAGGAMIQMKLYFASVMEYMMIWGTPIGSEGFSGRHFVGFWDTVLDGETWYYAEGQFERTVYQPGDRIWVGPYQGVGMNFTDGVWALEYARGPLPLSIPFGLADGMFSALDFPTVLRTLGIYMTLVGRHWRNPKAPGVAALKPLKYAGAVIPSLVGPPLTKWLAPPPYTGKIPDNDGNYR
jgi:C-8 sterol isomerase